MKKRINFLWTEKTVIGEKVKEAFSSVVPITLIVLILSFTLVPLDSGMFLAFGLGAFCVVVGIGLFTLGADTAMTPIGQYVGTTTMKSKNVWIIMLVCFIVGIMVTVSEPDIQVLAGQLGNSVSPLTLMLTIGVGVGVFLVVAFLRMVFKIPLSYLLVFLYVSVIVLSFFVPKSFVPLAFDSGGVTTGPMSVPFIISIGTGIASVRSDTKAKTEGFGFTALCSIGPILSVMILGIIIQPEEIVLSTTTIPHISNSQDLIALFMSNVPRCMKEVAVALCPIVVFFLIFQLFGVKTSKGDMVRILIGVAYTYVGLTLFILGVDTGFFQVGSYVGKVLGSLEYNWIIIPLGMLIGFYVVSAEPAVHVLTKQVFDITAGGVPKKALRMSLMLGVALSVGLAFLRILFAIPITYFLIPGYAIAIILTFLVPEIFTAIAFDSGGVASGAMTTSFVLPMALGCCQAVGGNVATEGFGVVAMVAMTPLITIQILGLVYKTKLKKVKARLGEKDVQEEDIIY